jgi:molecular chaperone GrpE
MTPNHDQPPAPPRRGHRVDDRRSSAGVGPAGSNQVESDEAADGGGALDPDVAELRRTLDECRDQYRRLAADFENFKRRKAQELSDRTRYASEEAARALLPVLDNLRRAVDTAPVDADPGFLDGVRLTVRQFEDALAALGVTPIPAVGEPFDPSVHEAIAGVPSPDVEQDTVIDEVQRGYRLHDRLLRPALVRVAHPAGARSSAD